MLIHPPRITTEPEYPFIEVYESIMFTYIRGISTEKGARVLEDFIQEYRKNRIED